MDILYSPFKLKRRSFLSSRHNYCNNIELHTIMAADDQSSSLLFFRKCVYSIFLFAGPTSKEIAIAKTCLSEQRKRTKFSMS